MKKSMKFGIWNYYSPKTLAGSLLWNLAETFNFSLGGYAPTVFGWMIGAKKRRVK